MCCERQSQKSTTAQAFGAQEIVCDSQTSDAELLNTVGAWVCLVQIVTVPQALSI